MKITRLDVAYDDFVENWILPDYLVILLKIILYQDSVTGK